MPGYPAPFGKFSAFDDNGNPLANGQVFTYQAGTSTPAVTYTTSTVTGGSAVPNANPVILDAGGRASIFIPDAATMTYKFIVKNAAGATIYTEDNISIPALPVTTTVTAVPAGCILPYGGTTAPANFVLCNGQSYPNSTFPQLQAVIGIKFGGDASNFNVPDLRQRFPLGVAASGVAATIGATGGTFNHVHTGAVHTHTIPAHVHAMPHTHATRFNGWTTQNNTPPLAGILQAGGSGLGSEASVTQANADQNTGPSSATNTALNTSALSTDPPSAANTGQADPPYLVVNYIIKTNNT